MCLFGAGYSSDITGDGHPTGTRQRLDTAYGTGHRTRKATADYQQQLAQLLDWVPSAQRRILSAHPRALSQAEGASLPADPNAPQVSLEPQLSLFLLLSSDWVQFDPLHRVALALDGSPISRLQELKANRPYPPSRSQELADEVMRSTHCAAKRSDMDYHATLMD
jgi:hypothetical protein